MFIFLFSKPPDSTIYYARELLCYSSEGNRVELLTVTSCKGLTSERESRLPDLFPENTKPRCHMFQNKKVFFLYLKI